MDELSPLIQEIEFHERFRGYDPEEVDAYVDRVAKAASLAQGRLAELQRRVEAAEERAQKARADTDGVSETEETLRRTLVLAQRTADAAVAEAREQAAALIADAEAKAQTTTTMADSRAEAQLRDAEERAGRMLAEAETDRRALVADAEAAAGAAADEARVRLEGEVHDLARTRDFLRDDVEILERHLREQRARLVSSVATLSDLLDAPDALRVAPVPETSGVEVAPAVGAAPPFDEGPATQLHDAVTVEPESEVPDPHVLTPEPPAEEPAPEPVVAPESAPEREPVAIESTVDESEVAETAPEELVADEPDGDDPAAEFEGDDAGEPVAAESAPDHEPQWAEPVGSAPPLLGQPVDDDEVIDLVAEEAQTTETTASELPPAPPRFTTAADVSDAPGPAATTEPSTGSGPVLQETALFDVAAEEDPFLSQLRDAVANDEAPTGELTAADDEAMSAFFDDEGDDDASRSWFGRRR